MIKYLLLILTLVTPILEIARRTPIHSSVAPAKIDGVSPFFDDILSPIAYRHNVAPVAPEFVALGKKTENNISIFFIVCSGPWPACSLSLFCSANTGACSAAVVCSANAGVCSAAAACSANAGVCSAAAGCSLNLGGCSAGGACTAGYGPCSVAAVACSYSDQVPCSVSLGVCSTTTSNCSVAVFACSRSGGNCSVSGGGCSDSGGNCSVSSGSCTFRAQGCSYAAECQQPFVPGEVTEQEIAENSAKDKFFVALQKQVNLAQFR